jgi:hypothetical protein
VDIPPFAEASKIFRAVIYPHSKLCGFTTTFTPQAADEKFDENRRHSSHKQSLWVFCQVFYKNGGTCLSRPSSLLLRHLLSFRSRPRDPPLFGHGLYFFMAYAVIVHNNIIRSSPFKMLGDEVLISDTN